MTNEVKQEVLTDILARIIDYRGKTPKKLGGDWSESGYRALSALQVKTSGLQNLDECHFVNEEIYKKWMKEEIQRGDILMTSEAPAGQVYYWDSDEKIVLSQRLFCLRVKSGHNPIYVKYYLQSNTGQKAIFGNLSGSTVSGVSAKTLKHTTIFTRSIAEETRIANLLYALDSKIATNNKIIELSESLMREIYDYWFIQFDFPDNSGRPYKSSGGKMVWNNDLKREIPEKWEAETFGVLCSMMNGINYDKNEAGDKEYRIVNVRNITSTSLILDRNEFDTIALRRSLADRYIISRDDILITRSGAPGAVRLLHDPSKNTIFCGFIIRCTPNDPNNKLYLAYSMKKLEGTSATKTGGSILQNVSQETLGRVMICVPPREVVEAFNSRISTIHSLIQNAIEENSKLTSLRDWLLPMLMNGQAKITG